MRKDIVDELHILVESCCKAESNVFGYGVWSHHVKPMISIAQKLAKEYGADEEVVVIACLLHDLAGIKDKEKSKNHHIHGAVEAVEILGKYNYPKEKIEKVRLCILNHRASVNNPKLSAEEICVADADAMVHMEKLDSLFFVAYKGMNMGIDEGKEWIRKKIQNDWNKLSEKGKARFFEKYQAIQMILGKA